jgi:hypothetical protein
MGSKRKCYAKTTKYDGWKNQQNSKYLKIVLPIQRELKKRNSNCTARSTPI